MQCHKLLWWKVHEGDAPELQVDQVLQDRFEQGRHVGEVARTQFAGGVLIQEPYRNKEAAIVTITAVCPALAKDDLEIAARESVSCAVLLGPLAHCSSDRKASRRRRSTCEDGALASARGSESTVEAR